MIFKLTRLALITAVLLTGIGMILYPGGTFFDRAVRRYSFFHNSLSDLGSTVAWNGQANPGAVFFLAAAIILVVAGCTCLLALIGVYSSSLVTGRLARTGGVAVIVAGAALAGAALTPEDLKPALHHQFSLLAVSSFPAGTAFLAAATALDARFPRRVPVGWLILTLIVAAWAGVMSSVHPTNSSELAIPVTVQKIVAITLVTTLVFESYEAENAGASGAMAAKAG